MFIALFLQNLRKALRDKGSFAGHLHLCLGLFEIIGGSIDSCGWYYAWRCTPCHVIDL